MRSKAPLGRDETREALQMTKMNRLNKKQKAPKMMEMHEFKKKSKKNGKSKYEPVKRGDTDDEDEESGFEAGRVSLGSNHRSFNYSIYSGHQAVSTHAPDEDLYDEEQCVNGIGKAQKRSGESYP